MFDDWNHTEPLQNTVPPDPDDPQQRPRAATALALAPAPGESPADATKPTQTPVHLANSQATAQLGRCAFPSVAHRQILCIVLSLRAYLHFQQHKTRKLAFFKHLHK